MKIRILSDLHLECCELQAPEVHADVIVLAGDIHTRARGPAWARKHFSDKPIVYVPGNHEAYGADLEYAIADLRKEAAAHDVTFLEGDAVTLDGVRFLGCTLWTDYALYGSRPDTVRQAMEIARSSMRDHLVIRVHGSKAFLPEHALEIHLEQVSWLTDELNEPCDGPTVVVTHHLPHPLSVHRKYERDALNPAFASDLSYLMGEKVPLWIHGHTHESCDYVANGTRVVCNPRGYIPYEPNPAFNPMLVVEVQNS